MKDLHNDGHDPEEQRSSEDLPSKPTTDSESDNNSQREDVENDEAVNEMENLAVPDLPKESEQAAPHSPTINNNMKLFDKESLAKDINLRENTNAKKLEETPKEGKVIDEVVMNPEKDAQLVLKNNTVQNGLSSQTESKITPNYFPDISIDGQTKPVYIVARIIKEMKSIGFYSLNGKSQFGFPIEENGESRIDTIDESRLPSFLVPHINFVKGTGSKSKNDFLNKKFVKAIFEHPEYKSLPCIRRVVQNAALDKDLKPLSAGFHKQSGIFLCKPVITALKGMNMLNEVLDSFEFSDESSKSNVLAALVGSFMYERIGRAPSLCISADGPGSGKSHLAKVISIIVDGGRYPVTGAMSTSRAEFEKTLGSLMKMQLRCIIVDNVRMPSSGSSTVFTILEKLITDERPSLRALGGNNLIERKSDILWILTANQLILPPDMSSRSIPIRLKTPDGGGREYKHRDLLGYVFENHSLLVGEILGMIEVARTAGIQPDRSIVHREAAWTQSVGGVLKANGVNRFLSNQTSACAAQNSDVRGIVLAVRRCKTISY